MCAEVEKRLLWEEGSAVAKSSKSVLKRAPSPILDRIADQFEDAG